MVCASVQGDNTQGLANGLSVVQMQNHIAPVCICTLCIENFDVKHWKIDESTTNKMYITCVPL